MPRKRKPKVITDTMTPDELAEAYALLGAPAIEIEGAAPVIHADERGTRVFVRGAWIKFSVSFRDGMLAKLRGAPLSVFVAIALHIDDHNEAYPSLELLQKETGWRRTSLIKATAKLMKLGLIEKIDRPGTTPVYRILAGVAYGREREPLPVQNLNGCAPAYGGSTPERTGVVRSSVPKEEPISRTKEGRSEVAADAGDPPTSETPRKGTRRQPDPRSRGPEIQSFKAVTGRYPHWTLYDKVIAAAKDRTDDYLRPFYAAWVARGYNPNAITWLTEWAARGAIPTPYNGRTPPESHTRQAPTPEEHAAAAALVAAHKARRNGQA